MQTEKGRESANGIMGLAVWQLRKPDVLQQELIAFGEIMHYCYGELFPLFLLGKYVPHT